MVTKAQERTYFLGEILTRVRAQELDQNQEDFARFLGVDTSTVSLWERNEVIPFRANLYRIKKKLMPYLTPEELASFENNSNISEKK